MRSGQPWASRPAVIISVGWLCFLGMLALFWVGPRGSDDALYWQAADHWFHAGPQVGAQHWDLRHTIVLPLVFARLLLGDGPLALALPSIVAGLAVIALAGVWVRAAAGTAAAWLAVILLATGSLMVLLSSTADIDFIEVGFILAALYLLHRAITDGPAPDRLLLGGIAMGLAMVSRETAAFAVAGIGVLFLAGYGMPRRKYAMFALGLAVVVLAEMGVYWLLTGDPLHRLVISLHHDGSIDRWAEKGSGLPAVHPLVDPLVMLLASHDFGAGFLLGLPILAVCLARAKPLRPRPQRRRPQRGERTLFIVLGCVAIVWTLIAAALWSKLALVSRYYALPLVCLTILTAVCLGWLWESGRRRLAALLLALLLGGNIAGCALDNRNFMFGEAALAALTAQEARIIHTDEQTLRRAALLLTWSGAFDRVTATPPGSGDLFLFNPPRAALAKLSPAPDWQVVSRQQPAPSLAQRLLARLAPVLPSWLARKLGPGHPGVTLYRVP